MVGGEFKVCGWGSDDDNDSMMNNFDGYRRRGLSLKIAYICILCIILANHISISREQFHMLLGPHVGLTETEG